MNGVINTIKGGQTVPLKFEVFDQNGQEITDTSIVDTFTQKKVSCSSILDQALILML